MEYLKLGPLQISIPTSINASINGLSIAGIITLGLAVRFVLISLGWPHTNIDEGTLGEMAMNIAFHGDHPLYYYGQNYMGSLQAYIAAGLFHLLGVSFFSLRLGLIFLFALFLMSMYLLTCLLYTKKLALFTLLVLCLGSSYLIYREVQAVGGWVETLFFGSFLFFLACWLALTSGQEGSSPLPLLHRLRMVAFFAWGVLVGLCMWSTVVVAPYILTSGLLLLIFCWHEIRSLAPLCLVLGLLLGGLPLIYYNLHAAHDHDSLSTLIILFHGGAAHGSIRKLLVSGITNTLLISLPVMTGDTFVCDTSSTLFVGGKGPGAFQCVAAQAAWSLVWLALWASAMYLSLRTIWQVSSRSSAIPHTFEQRQTIIRSIARMALLVAAGVSLLLFAMSPTSTYSPYLSSRYIYFVLFATPALLYPLWQGASGARASTGKFTRIFRLGFKRLALVGIVLLFLIGTIRTFGEIPATRAENMRQEDLVQQLLHIGAKHIYSDFWSCDRIVFQSLQQIACSVLTDNLHLLGDRYKPNGVIVQSDPMSSYVFPLSSAPAKAFAQHIVGSSKQYRQYTFDGYVVYQPL